MVPAGSHCRHGRPVRALVRSSTVDACLLACACAMLSGCTSIRRTPRTPGSFRPGSSSNPKGKGGAVAASCMLDPRAGPMITDRADGS